MTLALLGILLATGLLSGLLAGLLGVGGGLVLVPVLVALFDQHGVPAEHGHHMAVGTSLACIVFTSLSSLRAHHLKRAVDGTTWRRMAPGMVVGTLLGSLIAGQLPPTPLQVVFVLFAWTAATQMLTDVRPKPTRQLPGWGMLTLVGQGIGLLSSWVGIGGGSLTVPYLIWHNVTMHRAVGTSAALGLPIAAAGLLGFAWAGSGKIGLPPHTLGYVYLPAILGITLGSVLTAPLGARLAHRLPVKTLKRIFAALLIGLAAHMAWKLGI